MNLLGFNASLIAWLMTTAQPEAGSNPKLRLMTLRHRRDWILSMSRVV
jgi:hypothetical protein